MIKRILDLTILLFMIVTLICYVGWHVGYDGLILAPEGAYPAPWLQPVLCLTLFAANQFFLYGYSANDYSGKSVLIALAYIPIQFSASVLGASSIACMVLAISYILALAAIKTGLKIAVRRFLVIFSISTSYQFLSAFTKFGQPMWDGRSASPYQIIMTSIDLLLLLSVVYCSGGEKFYGLEHSVYPQDVHTAVHDHEDDQAVDAWNRMQGFTRVKAMALLLVYHLAQFGAILWVCKLGNVLIEGLTTVLSFLVFGLVIKRRWHSKSLLVCSSLTIVIFYVSARALPNFKYSQLLPVVIGLLIVYSLYRVAVYVHVKNSLEELHGCRLDRDGILEYVHQLSQRER